MYPETQALVSSSEEVRSQLVQHLQEWIDPPTEDSPEEGELLDALGMLSALPLSTSEFTLAVNRLRNARRYLAANEPGAARFELRLLLGSVRDREYGRPIRRTFRRHCATDAGQILKPPS